MKKDKKNELSNRALSLLIKAKKQGVSNYAIAKITGITRTSITNYIEKSTRPTEANANLLIQYITDDGKLRDGKLNDTPIGITPFAMSEFRKRGYSPFYSALKVSAGQYDLAAIAQQEEPESWIKFPGVIVEAFFPIIGCSFEPKIYAGDHIGVVSVNRWDRLDPDKIYMVVTKDERMIKCLEVDEENSEFIWAVSPNHKRFKVYINEILRLFHVVWVGRLV